MKKILVIITVSENVNTLSRALKSALEQSYKGHDILLLDDGSTHLVETVLSNFEDSRITYQSDNHKNRNRSRNQGIAYAREHGYDFICFLDAEDYWSNNHLDHLRYLSEIFPEATVYGMNYQIKSGRNMRNPKFSNFQSTEPQVLTPFFSYNFKNLVLMTSSSAIKTDALDGELSYHEEYTHGADIDLWIRLGMHEKIAFHFNKTCVKDEGARNQPAKTSVSSKRFIDLDKYEKQAEQVPHLKKFLDLNRFSLSLAHRLENDIKAAVRYQKPIHSENLTRQQRQLLDMSRLQLKKFKRTNKVLGRMSWNLRSVN